MFRPFALAALIAAGLARPASASYDARTGAIVNERWASGVPLGGLGTGKIEVFTDGSFGRVTINHNWDRPTDVLPEAYATVRVRDGSVVKQRILRLGSTPGTAVPGVARVEYRGEFPVAYLRFTDPALPVRVDLRAWASLIPNNARDSSLPAAHLDYTVTNLTKRRLGVSISVSWPNILGFGGRRGHPEWTGYAGNRVAPARVGRLSGVLFTTSQRYDSIRQNVVGQYFLATSSPGASTELSDGTLSGRPVGSVFATTDLPPGGSTVVPFILAWAMPTHRVAHTTISGYSPAKEDDSGVAAAVDNDPATRWTTNHYMRPNEVFEITLPSDTPLGTLTLDSSGSPTDWPHGYNVELIERQSERTIAHSTEAEAETRQQHGVLNIDLSGNTGRRIDIVNLGASTQYYWSIHELRLTGADGTTIPLTAANLHAYTTEPIYKETPVENVGHYWQNYFHNAREIAAYASANAPRLWKATAEWQNVVATSNLPVWFKRQMINSAFPAFANTVFTKDGRFSVLESPIDMAGALGTMDQRMAAHALWIQFFSAQDRKELDMYAHAQDLTPQKDGRITHFVGNVHESVGDPNVDYGVTDWPDLTSSWILQTLKEYRWTGDSAFLRRNVSHIRHGMLFLKNGDTDGDLIPEGGSTYDYEHMPRGAFIYNASCDLAALRAAAAMERTVGNPVGAAAFDAREKATQASVMRLLWNGHGFRKWVSPATGARVENSFVASLAGDWLAQLTGLPRTLPNKVVNTTIVDLLKRHLWAFNPVPPMEVKPDGTAFTSTCFAIQHQPYLGDEAIYQGYADDGMEMQRRIYEVAWPRSRSPWDESLIYYAPQGAKGGLVSYMTCPATWHTLNALTGTTLDIPARTFYVSPHVPKSMGALHVPVFFPTFWARVDAVPATKTLRVTILKTFGETPAFRILRGDVDGPAVILTKPLPVRTGATWDLSRYWSHLTAPTHASLRP